MKFRHNEEIELGDLVFIKKKTTYKGRSVGLAVLIGLDSGSSYESFKIIPRLTRSSCAWYDADKMILIDKNRMDLANKWIKKGVNIKGIYKSLHTKEAFAELTDKQKKYIESKT